MVWTVAELDPKNEGFEVVIITSTSIDVYTFPNLLKVQSYNFPLMGSWRKPRFVDLTGDKMPELIMTTNGQFAVLELTNEPEIPCWIYDKWYFTGRRPVLGTVDIDDDGLKEIITCLADSIRIFDPRLQIEIKKKALDDIDTLSYNDRNINNFIISPIEPSGEPRFIGMGRKQVYIVNPADFEMICRIETEFDNVESTEIGIGDVDGDNQFEIFWSNGLNLKVPKMGQINRLSLSEPFDHYISDQQDPYPYNLRVGDFFQNGILSYSIHLIMLISIVMMRVLFDC